MKAWKKGAIVGAVVGFLYGFFLMVISSGYFRPLFLLWLIIMGGLFGTVVGLLIQSYKENKLRDRS